MFCYQCGAKVPENAAFCTSCGASLKSDVKTEATQSQENVNNDTQAFQYQNQNYQQPPFQQPPRQQQDYYQPRPQQAPNYQTSAPMPGMGMGIAGLVLGIISICLFCVYVISLPCAIIGFILAMVGYNDAKNQGRRNNIAISGIVTSSIGFGLALFYLCYFFSMYDDIFNDFYYYFSVFLG